MRLRKDLAGQGLDAGPDAPRLAGPAEPADERTRLACWIPALLRLLRCTTRRTAGDLLHNGDHARELSYGPHATDDPLKRAGRVAVLQHVESTFEPLPYDHQ